MNIICNIPHAGTEIPNWAMDDFLITPIELKILTEKLVDLDVDKLFSFVEEENKVVSNISRIVVDMERYKDDADEPMAKLGMGLFYTKDDKGKEIREKSRTYTKCIDLYDNYHAELESKVKAKIEKTGRCYIIDCHSFHDNMLYTGYSSEDFPDVCLGFNDKFPSNDIVWIKELFENNGYMVKFNIPFGGSIVPLKYLQDNRVKSVMLELNRRIYCQNNEDFRKVQSLCKEIYNHLDR